VIIDRRVSGAWQPFLTATLDADSRFALPWKPGEFGFYRLRARMEADTEHATGTARSELVIVNRPNAHKVPMRYAHYIVIVRHEYRLYYYEHGAVVRAFNVALGRPGYRTPLGYYRVYGKRKPAGGALGACAMFYRRQGGIAIHGTNEPWLIRRPIPRAFSHGCARMLNGQVLWLYDRVPVGTRIHNLR
jgi:lipoprotein-anchoring transpeptidase ErfK/SrfK